MSMELVLAEVKKLNASVEAQGKEITELKKKSAANPRVKDVFGIRRGPDTMSSKPYSFLKALSLYKGYSSPQQAPLEADISKRMCKAMKESGYTPDHDNMMFVPLWTDALGDEHHEFRQEIKSLMRQPDVDYVDQLKWMVKRGDWQQKDLSWLTDNIGGSLVPAAAQGELIDYLRNVAALIGAGAPTFPLPPQGSISFPKQTGAMTAGWIGEKSTISKSDLATGSVMLRAKKLGVRGSIPNELFKYSNPAADAMVRNDAGRVLALALDLSGLEGTGGLQPTGLIVGTGGQAILTYTASVVGANGNTFAPQDWSKLLGVIENSNGIVNENAVGFICRPKFYRFSDAYRADALSAGDQAGTFVDLLKSIQDKPQKTKVGYPVVTSNQVSGTRTKSGGTTLSYVIAGDWSQLLIGMGPALELDMNPWGDTQWQTDQTEIRGIMQADIAHRHRESFAWCDQLLQA